MSMETVLVTGASSGIGRELAGLFAAEKSRLVLVARRKDKLEELASRLRTEHGIEVHVLPQDLARPDGPQAILERISAEGVTVDVLVNNAGFGAAGPVTSLPLDRQMDMIQVNVAALTQLTRLFLPGMLQRGRGGVLNVASIAGFQPGPFMAVYYATKAYVLSFSEALAEELSGTPVRVTCLAPGPTTTEFASEAGVAHLPLFNLGLMDAAAAARAGHRGFRRGKVLVVPGLRNKLLAASVRFAPRYLVRKLVRRLQWRD